MIQKHLFQSPSAESQIGPAVDVDRGGDTPPRAAHIPWLGMTQLGAFTSLLYLFRIESENFFRVFLVGFAGFAISALSGRETRHWLFLATSVVGGVVTIGPAATLAIGLVAGVIIAVSRLRVPPLARLSMVLGILGSLAFARAWTPLHPFLAERLGMGALFWPIVGSIFAFRAFIFLYDTSHGLGDVPLPQQLVYFVLLPNFALPLFPIVDYRNFVRAHTLEPNREDFDAGSLLLLTGFAHLIVYRLVYHYLVLGTSGATSPLRNALYVVSFYLLYLRVSGLFHMVIGLLHFFGYRLPPTHQRHLLSQNFSEFWRRTNTYWKDFNQKFVFTPLAAALEPRLPAFGLQVAVFLSLIISWAIHSYQFFWLVGRPLLEIRDLLFWLILAIAMVAATTREVSRRARIGLGPKRAPTRLERIQGACKTLGFFVMISVLWSFWSAPSWAEWVHAMGFGSD